MLFKLKLIHSLHIYLTYILAQFFSKCNRISKNRHFGQNPLSPTVKGDKLTRTREE